MRPQFLASARLPILLVLISPVYLSTVRLDAQEQTGQLIYRQMCASCHGAAGEGTKHYAQPLVGQLSPAGLVRKIAGTMPEDDPDKLSAAGAKLVSEYIHSAFYSPDAQARLSPPRIELSRLTVAQYRSAVADLIGSFRRPRESDTRQGLRGVYASRGKGVKAGNETRYDREVQFEFGTEAPKLEKVALDPFSFSINWDGSVLAPETGTYEFVVKTQHAMRLWVNDLKRPVIDASVKSGSDTEFRISLFLLGGRSYSIKLEFSKGLRGGNDNEKNKKRLPPEASISLLWKRPGAADEVIPARYLSPARAPEVAIIKAPFPADDRSLGWERGTGISKEWDAASTEAAYDVADYVTTRLNELSGVSDQTQNRGQRLQTFCQQFVERAFRRPLTAAEVKTFIARQFDATKDPTIAVKRVVLLTMKSPRFWYPELSGGAEPFAVATRLALALWDAPPDKLLLDAAASGKLSTHAEVAIQAERMLSDPRARAKMRQFLLTWLKVEQPHDLAKDAKEFPEFNAALTADLRASLELFLEDTVWSETSDFRQLLLADEIFLNARLARFYGVDLPADAAFQKVKLDPGQRAGVLTHPYTLAALSYAAESSPVHRGVFVARGLLGVTLRPPPEAFTPLPAEQHPDLSTRERVALQTKAASCVGCHSTINPLGFTLENFDAVGRYRQKEHGKPIDVSGSYETRDGVSIKFTGPRELATFLAGSEEVHAAFVQQLFHHLIKQPVRAYGLQRPEELRRAFVASNYNIRKMMVEIATIGAMTSPAPANTSK